MHTYLMNYLKNFPIIRKNGLENVIGDVQMGTCPILHILTQHQRANRGTSPTASPTAYMDIV